MSSNKLIKTVFKRELPKDLISFSSTKGNNTNKSFIVYIIKLNI